MPGYVRYFYKDGTIPTGTKSSFNSLSVLTVHSIIACNAINFMNKIHNFFQPVTKVRYENYPTQRAIESS
jgi:hypothetical protein